jgi:hypothetical protein
MNECARRHRNFTSLTAFDRHQDRDYHREPPVLCRDPASVGLVERAGRWSLPASGYSRARAEEMRAELAPA